MNIENYPEVLPTNYQEIKEEPENAADGTNEAADGTDADGQKSAGGNVEGSPSDTEGSSNETADNDVVPGGLRTAGDAGESGGRRNRELLNTAADATHGDVHQLSNWQLKRLELTQNKKIRMVKLHVDQFVDIILAQDPEETDPEDELNNLRMAYNYSVDLAAAVEQLLIIREKKAAKQDG